MKAVLISIQPKWIVDIARGRKTVEVRKNKPKLETPFKAYIYATWNGSKKEILVKQDGQLFCKDWRKANGLQRASGKVIGEFVCDRIDEFIPSEYGVKCARFEALHETSLTVKEMREYLQGKTGYGWHITDLKIYDKPKELSEFLIDCKNCGKKFVGDPNCWQGCVNGYRRLTRPPQSWCYVEEL